MKSLYITLISVLICFFMSVEPAKQGSNCKGKRNINSDNGSNKEYIVVLDKSGPAKATHYEWLKNCHNKRVDKFTTSNSNNDEKDIIYDMSMGGTTMYSAWFTDSTIKELKERKEVKSVEKVEKKMRINSVIPRDNQSNALPNLDRINQAKFPLDGIYSFPSTAGRGVNIFVVDTGIFTNHSEFEGRAKAGASFCSSCPNKSSNDDNGHGSHVAATAGGKTVGVAKEVTLIAVKVLAADGSGSNKDVIDGLKFVLNEHTKSTNKNSVVSMSLGGAFSPAVNEAVKSLTDNGVHVVVAAGNEGTDACGDSPASEPTAITVGATEKGSDVIADFSNIGKCLDIFAPGVDIKSAGIKNADDTAVFSGTSQATPHVSGTIALIIAKGGNKSPADMAKTLIDLSTKGVVTNANDTGSPNNFVRVPSP